MKLIATTSATLNVKGMSCNHYVNAIESALKELNGVQAAQVDLKANKVTVLFDDAVVSSETLKGAIEETGYDIA